MKGYARTVTIGKGVPPTETLVTAVRSDGPRPQPQDISTELLTVRDGLLSSLLDGTGVPADNWTISTDPGHPPPSAEIGTAELAAIFAAHHGGESTRPPDGNTYHGSWGYPGIRPDRRGRAERGAAVAMRRTARFPGGFVSPSDMDKIRLLLPRTLPLPYAEPETPHDLQAIVTGRRGLTRHEPVDLDRAHAEAALHELQVLSRLPASVIRALAGPAAEAVRTGLPLTIRSIGTGPRGYGRLREIILLVRHLMGPLSPTEAQEVIETGDLAYAAPSTGPELPLPRPHRAPRPSAPRERFIPLSARSPSDPYATPGELDRTVHGTLMLGAAPGARVNAETARLILRDRPAPGKRRLVILIDHRSGDERRGSPPTDHPFDTPGGPEARWPAGDRTRNAVTPDETAANERILTRTRAACATPD